MSLFSLYLIYKFFNKEHINYVLTAYFTCIGIATGTKFILTCLRMVTGYKIKGDYHLLLNGKKESTYTKQMLSVYFGYTHFACIVISTAVGVYYAVTKNWIVSNFYAEALSCTAIQLLNLESFKAGILLLSGF